MSLLEIKKKISGVKNTRKITKAMQLVAASKRIQFQKKAVSTREFVAKQLCVLANNMSADSKSIFTEHRKSGYTAYVLYSSDKGLCGALNTKLINCLFRSEEWKNTAESEKKLVVIGNKAKTAANSRDIAILKSFVKISEAMSELEALELVSEIISIYLDPKCKQVKIVAPHYKNSFTFYPVIKTFLPFSEEMLETHIGSMELEITPKNHDFMIFEPSAEVVLDKLYQQIVQALFLQALYELKASEYSSRMIAMKNATDSADKIIKNLTLDLNKARQAAITQEIAELAGAQAAMN